jgi:thiamine monophosphate synthase
MLPRYELLLRAVLKYTPPERGDFAELEQAIQGINNIVQLIDQKRGYVEASAKVKEVQSLINGCPVRRRLLFLHCE